MKKLRNYVLVLAVTLGLGFLAPVTVNAASNISAQCEGVTDSVVCNRQNANPGDLAKNIVNVLLFIIGAISVVMIIVGGIMYSISAGDTSQVTRAKNTLTYAIVGLVVSFLAYAIVNYVVKLFIK